MRGYTDDPLPGHTYPVTSRPYIVRHHVDGPVVCFRDGQMHWLTLWERLMLCLKLTDARKIERKRRPNLMRALKETP
jgi:hypothetical protein